MEENRQSSGKKITNISKRKSKITIILLAVFVLTLGANAYFWNQNRKAEEEVLKIGFITDVHCYSKFNKDSQQWEVNWRCERPMSEFVRQMNKKFKPDFVIENGDFVDGRDRRGEEGFHIAKVFFDQIEAPKYHVLGNHEAESMSKDRWGEIVGRDSTHYYFDIKGYRVVVLDASFYQKPETGEIVDITSETPEAWKAFINKEQLVWLDQTLKDAENHKKIIFIHQPPFNETVGRERGETFTNPEELRTVLSENDVLAVFSGHVEEICDVEIDGVRYFTFQGFHKISPSDKIEKAEKYKDKGVFHEIRIDGEQIDIEMFFSEGKEEPYQSIKINQETAVCNNSTLPSQ